MAVRDSFSQTTKTNLAKRAAYICSSPDCRAFTLGARAEGDGVVNIGVAAHITAAAAGGPRFDPDIDTIDRASEQNGLWLCANCHTRIDTDPTHFTVAKLRDWKRDAEARSFEQLGRRPLDLDKAIRYQPEIIAHDYLVLKDALATKGPPIDDAVDSWRKAALRDVTDFKALRTWPASPIDLSVRSSRVDEEDSAVPNFAAVLEIATDVIIASAPGTGKSTTMIQLAGTMLDAGRRVAIYVPLAQWGAQQADLLLSLTARAPFAHLDLDALRLLAAEGRLVLLLDGWNELDPKQRLRLKLQLQQLRREYPLLVLVVATRAHTDRPVEGPVFQIEALREDEQLEAVRRMRGEEGVAVLDAAWRVAGLRDLVAIPLFLTALLDRAIGAVLPRSKDEILEGYVRAQARDDARADSLREELEDMAFRYLEALARAMREDQRVLFEAERARAIVSKTGQALLGQGQIGAAPKPGRALEILSDLHLLERPGDGMMFQFQHQQIQEWFASRDVEATIRSAADGDEAALTWLRGTVMNWRHWDETLLFAVERISASASADALQLLALLVNEALRLDPDLAGEIIARAPEAFWSMAGPAIRDFAAAWHASGMVDRAVDFIITTGRPEFADFVWPLITDQNSQIHLRTLRAGNGFRPSVLGEDAAHRIAQALPEVRSHILQELASNGGMEGIELATLVAESDPDPDVRLQTFSALEFRSASRHAVRILRASGSEVWDLAGGRGYWDGIDDPEVVARLKTINAGQRSALADPVALLHALLEQAGDTDAGRVREILADPAFPVGAERIYHLTDRLAARWPKEVADAMVDRLEGGLPLPFRAETLLLGTTPVDDGLLIERVLNSPPDDEGAKAAARLAGTGTVTKLIDQALAGREALPEEKEQRRKAYWAAVERATASPVASLVEALTAFSAETDPQHIHDIVEIINRHHGGVDVRPLALTEEQALQMVALIEGWAQALLGNPVATRSQVAALAVAIERVPREELLVTLEALLVEDLERYRRDWEQFRGRPSRYNYGNDLSMAFGMQFSRAFVAIGGQRVVCILSHYLVSPRFGADAAMALRRIFAHRTDEAEKKFGQAWPDFSTLAASATGKGHPSPGPEAAALFDAISRLTGERASVADREQALYLLKVMLGMPHADHPAIRGLLRDTEVSPLAKRDAMAALAMAGVTLPEEPIRLGLAAFLKQAEGERWLLDNDQSDLGRWLALFPFSDRPDALFDAIAALEPALLRDRNIEAVCEALRWAPTGVGDTGLVDLAERLPALKQNFTWQAAVLHRPERSAFSAFCDLLEAGSIVRNADSHAIWSLGDKLAGKLAGNPTLRDVYLARYRSSQGVARSVYDHAIAKMHDPDNVPFLVECYASWGRSFDGILAEALRNCALSYRTSERMTGSQEILPVDLASLRRQLFAIMRDGSPQSPLARDCLELIEELRRDYGAIDTEPRHPDVAKGMPWPLEEGQLPGRAALEGKGGQK
ncbi:hypothetical protein [Sphingomonas sp. PP-CE-1G-424]|uniref:NACHT domain-containing protein n=1 Tax=Sphingomonas sp. PP-CE-1G-424 TaxID=2135658 RepID=UPI001056219D|nr:hypothetical protein [Sphingomonas sp. PP-CE-1G-424]TCP66148.1 hypothetical protein C8J43_10645 [Sphingomonas sp. PP-CE-1G-424]